MGQELFGSCFGIDALMDYLHIIIERSCGIVPFLLLLLRHDGEYLAHMDLNPFFALSAFVAIRNRIILFPLFLMLLGVILLFYRGKLPLGKSLRMFS